MAQWLKQWSIESFNLDLSFTYTHVNHSCRQYRSLAKIAPVLPKRYYTGMSMPTVQDCMTVKAC